MKERPILFSAPMVRAILDGRKSQTRRVVKGKALEAIEFCTGRADDTPAESRDLGVFYDRSEVEDSLGRTRTLKRPEWLFYCAEYPGEGSVPVGQGYGAVGDRLWVRETSAHVDGSWVYRADVPDLREERAVVRLAKKHGTKVHPWTPAIHMPRIASRITLEITGVRVERLQDISAADARAEGIQMPAPTISPIEWDHNCVVAYRHLWESINGDSSWDANPWVWVVEFKRVADEARAAA